MPSSTGALRPVWAGNIATLWIAASRSATSPRNPSPGPLSRDRMTSMEHQMTSVWFTGPAAAGVPDGAPHFASVVVARAGGPYGDGLTSSVSTDRSRHSAVPTPARNSEDHNEAAVSAQRAQAGEEAWIPFAHEHPWRTRGAACSPSEGPSSPVGVIDRLRGRAAFARVRAEGRRHGSGPIRLVSRFDTTTDARIAFAIPRSVGNAVERNRIRRRIRAILDDEARDDPDFPARGDHVIRITAPIDDWSPTRLRSVMIELLRSPASEAQAPEAQG